MRAVGVYPEYYRFTVEVGLAATRLGHMVGLLGDANGITHDDLVTRTGQPIALPDPPFALFYGTYVNSWRISNAESMFDYGPGQSTETFTDLTFPDAPVTPQTLPAADSAAATALCNLFGITDQAVLDACIVDVGITGDADFATTAADAQEAGLGIPTNAGAMEIGPEVDGDDHSVRRERGPHLPGHGRPASGAAGHRQHVRSGRRDHPHVDWCDRRVVVRRRAG